MKKMKLFAAVLVLAMLLSCLAGCGECEHQWQLADCKDPKTCKLCGATEGEATGKHSWEEATTDAPKTCKFCGTTEGEKIEVDERFTTKACKSLFGNWEVKYEMTAVSLGATELVVEMKRVLRFTNEGDLIVVTEPYDKTAFEEEFTQWMIDAVYNTCAEKGMDRAQADAWCVEEYGKNVSDYCHERAPQITRGMSSREEKVYYVEDGVLYTGEDWGDRMSSKDFVLTEDGKLQMEDSELDMTLEFVRVANVIK